MEVAPNQNLQYAYQYLDQSQDEIRLVDLLPGSRGANPRCHLRTARLSRHPKYEAVSYTWGAPTEPQSNLDWILLDETPYEIRKNLWDFLNELQCKGSQRTLWIDAICIDQANVSERNHQVQFMSRIFSGASCVLIWLGPQADKSSWVFDFLTTVVMEHDRTESRNRWSKKCGITDYRVDVPEERLVPNGAAAGAVLVQYPGHAPGLFKRLPQSRLYDDFDKATIWTAIGKLCERQYWTRAWILQEILLASDLMLFCGDKVAPWQSLLLLLSLVEQKEFKTFSSFNDRRRQQLANATVARLIHQRSPSLREQRIPLQELLERYGLCACTDVRDRVYALLGLASDCNEGEGLKADYSLSPIALHSKVIDFCHPKNHEEFADHMANVLNIAGEERKVLLEIRALPAESVVYSRMDYRWRVRSLLPLIDKSTLLSIQARSATHGDSAGSLTRDFVARLLSALFEVSAEECDQISHICNMRLGSFWKLALSFHHEAASRFIRIVQDILSFPFESRRLRRLHALLKEHLGLALTDFQQEVVEFLCSIFPVLSEKTIEKDAAGDEILENRRFETNGSYRPQLIFFGEAVRMSYTVRDGPPCARIIPSLLEFPAKDTPEWQELASTMCWNILAHRWLPAPMQTVCELQDLLEIKLLDTLQMEWLGRLQRLTETSRNSWSYECLEQTIHPLLPLSSFQGDHWESEVKPRAAQAFFYLVAHWPTENILAMSCMIQMLFRLETKYLDEFSASLPVTHQDIPQTIALPVAYVGQMRIDPDLVYPEAFHKLDIHHGDFIYQVLWTNLALHYRESAGNEKFQFVGRFIIDLLPPDAHGDAWDRGSRRVDDPYISVHVSWKELLYLMDVCKYQPGPRIIDLPEDITPADLSAWSTLMDSEGLALRGVPQFVPGTWS